MRLSNKTAVLSGIGPRMGRATAILFAQEGANVVLTARRIDQLEETLSRIKSIGGKAIVVPGDLTNQPDVDNVLSKTMETFGRLDILYSGAGGYFEPTRSFELVDLDFWNQALGNTLNSAYNLIHAAHPIMKDGGGGSIITVAASRSVRLEANPAYAAAKSGVIALSQNLAKELYSDNIRVNTIASGLIRGQMSTTEIQPGEDNLMRAGYPEDIAYASLYLASSESSWITGQVLSVDGGIDVGARPLWQYER